MEEYFNEVRNIERDLPTELGLQIMNQMLAGLDDKIIRKVVRSYVRRRHADRELYNRNDRECK